MTQPDRSPNGAVEVPHGQRAVGLVVGTVAASPLEFSVGVAPEDFLMVGNTVRSDVLPVLAIGERPERGDGTFAQLLHGGHDHAAKRADRVAHDESPDPLGGG